MLEDLNAQLVCGPGFAGAEVERVQMAIAHVDQAADISVSADRLLRFGFGEQAVFPRKPVFFQLGHILFEVTGLAPVLGDVDVAGFQVTVDRVFLHPLVHDFVAAPAHVPDGPGNVFAKMFDDLFVAAEAANQLAAVAARSAPADAVGFDQRHLVAALGQRQRRGHPGKTAADDADVGAVAAL